MACSLWRLRLKANMPFDIIIPSALGLCIGTILALTGAGGTVLAIPFLCISLHLSITQASPIALLAILVAASIGAIQGFIKGIVRYKAAMLIATLGIILAPLGVKLAFILPQALLATLLSAVLFYVAIRTWKNVGNINEDNTEMAPASCEINPATSKLFWTAACTKRLMATGALTGLLSGLLGVGGGFVIVPSLKKVSNFNHATIIATTLAVIALVSVSAIASHMQHAIIQWSIAIPFIISTTIAMLVINQFSHFINTKYSQQLFAVLCLLAGISLIIKAM